MENKLQNYIVSVLYFVIHSIINVTNDVIIKYLTFSLSVIEIVFFRYLFSALTLVPLIYFIGVNKIKTEIFFTHIVRSVILVTAIFTWSYSLKTNSIIITNTLSFSIPIFTLVLSSILLNEKIIWQRWLVTIITFLGILITMNVYDENFDLKILIPIIATFLFSILDIINKRIVTKENLITTIFYSSFIIILFSTPIVIYSWKTPTYQELTLLLFIGIGGNLILYFILKAFSLSDISALAPYRYLELVIVIITAFIFFKEMPSINTIFGAILIIGSTLFIIYSEKKHITT